MADVLKSKWDGLSQHLLASLYPVDRRGNPLADEPSVVAPITDANIEVAANWQSPFEQSGVENKAPFITALLQSGGAESLLQLVPARFREGDGAIANLSREVAEFSRAGENRSGMTKLNSTQIYSGSPPLKITLTMHFRAFDNPATEVQAPTDQIIRWALAAQLAPNGNLVSALSELGSGNFLKALLPSEAPQPVAFRYGGQLFAPMVIESCTKPMTVPRTIDGEMLHVTMQLNLASLTSMDRGDWDRSRQSKPIKLFNNT